MSDSNKISIKVNIQNKPDNPVKLLQQKEVTEWNIKRIVAASLLLLLIVGLVIFSVYKKPLLPVTKPEIILPLEKKLSQVVPEKKLIEPLTNEPIIEKKPVVVSKILQSSHKEAVVEKIQIKVLENDSVYTEKLDFKKITRASLSTGILEKEPIGIFDSSISVNKNQAVAVYYFTEIIAMKGQVLYHQWRWNNQIVFSKKINIIGNRWRATTSKLISYNKVGVWTVRLINQSDTILNELKFEVFVK